MHGTLIVIEGLDGSGKNTQAKMLYESMSKAAKGINYMSFPDYSYPSSILAKMYLDGEFGSKPSDVNAYAAASFFAVDRYLSFKKKWGKNYKNGEIIICDRYTTSNTSYQMAKLPQGLWDEYLNWLYNYEYNKLELPRPDAVIYLDMPLDISQNLMKERYGGDNSKKDVHEANVEYLKKCELAAKFVSKKDNWNMIKCTDCGKIKDKNQVHEEIVSALKEIIKD